MKRHAKKHRRKSTANSQKNSRRGTLLKSACAGLLGIGLGDAAVQAFEVNEATSPLAVDGEFVDSDEGTPLPVGVTSILGSVGLFPENGAAGTG